jgi:hypothetical protein
MQHSDHYAVAQTNPSVADLLLRVSGEKLTNARIIEREFTAAGFKPPVVAAAIINAIAESGLRNDAVGDAGASVGLFQLHERGGGRGMSNQDRMDPVKNTRRIIEEAKDARNFMQLVNSGETDVKKLAAAFSTYVERPADKPGNEIKRAAMVDTYFGSNVSLILGARSGAPLWLWVALPVASLSLLGLIYVLSRRGSDDTY